MTTINPRSIGVEGQFITTDVAELAALKQELVDRELASPGAANGIVGWLVDKAAAQPDATSSQTRSQYRKILAELEQQRRPTPPRRRRGRGDRGATRPPTALVLASTAGAAQLVATGHPAAAAALFVVSAPIILEPSVMSTNELAA